VCSSSNRTRPDEPTSSSPASGEPNPFHAEALDRAAELRPDVTLLDVELGRDDGFALARAMVDDPRVEAGHLILLSVHSLDDLAGLVEASPAAGFLDKAAVSAEAIESLLRGTG
jgi:CheY-like chemotaxis protein